MAIGITVCAYYHLKLCRLSVNIAKTILLKPYEGSQDKVIFSEIINRNIFQCQNGDSVA